MTVKQSLSFARRLAALVLAAVMLCVAVPAAFAEDAAPRTLIAGKAIFDCMEACCDLCGHAADVMDQIIIKNT